MGILKSASDQRQLKQAATAAQVVCDALMAMLEPGLSTVTLEQEANRLLGLQRSSAPFKQFEGFNHAMRVD